MSDTYTKLFSSITESTVWGEPYATRIVWVAMLAMADAKGNVYGAVPGLARRANVTLQEVEAALESFRNPDPYSRTKEADGRRVEDIDGGWRLINHGKYGAIRDAEERREYKREWDRQNRSKTAKQAEPSDTDPDQSDKNPTKPTVTTPPTPTPAPTPEEDQERLSSAKPTTDLLGKTEPPADLTTRRAERLATVTEDAIRAYNQILGKPNGLLASVSKLGRKTRRKEVQRMLQDASEICLDQFGDKRVTPEFWETYFNACNDDPWMRGDGPYTGSHANWRPDFEYLTRPATVLKVFERATQEEAA